MRLGLILYSREGEEERGLLSWIGVPCIRACKVRNSVWLIVRIQGWRCGMDLGMGTESTAFLLSRSNAFVVGMEIVVLVVIVVVFQNC